MVIHVDDASGSHTISRVFSHGKRTRITRRESVGLPPDYKITENVFVDEATNESFDVLATRGVGLTNWLVTHLENNQGGSSEDQINRVQGDTDVR